MERDQPQLDPYAWATEMVMAERAGQEVDDSWVVSDDEDEAAFMHQSVPYSFYPAQTAIEKATEALGGPAGVAETEAMLRGAADTKVQRDMLARMSPQYRAAFMELAARKMQALLAEEA